MKLFMKGLYFHQGIGFLGLWNFSYSLQFMDMKNEVMCTVGDFLS